MYITRLRLLTFADLWTEPSTPAKAGYLHHVYSFLCAGAARFALADLTFPKSLAWWLFLGCTQLFSDDTSHRVELQSQVFTSWFVCGQAPTRPLIALCDWLQFLSHWQIFKLLVQQLHMSHYFDIPLMPLDEWKVIIYSTFLING